MTNRFDQGAASWDAKEDRTKMAASVTAAIRKEVPLNKKMQILDFGCGTGLISLSLSPDVASLTGVDNSTGMLEVFMEKAATQNLPNVQGLNLNLAGGDDLTGSYDLILSSMTFHHVKDVPALLMKLFKGLKPGGYLCVADLDPDNGLFHADNSDIFHFGFEREVMMDLFRSAGLTKVRASTAAVMPRLGEDGVQREFLIFLVTGVK